MLTSKELLARAGVSRATLNNYIALGLIPRPVVKAPDTPGTKARRIGYFPEDTLDRLRQIDALKRRGVRMSEIAARLKAEPPRPTALAARKQGGTKSGDEASLPIEQLKSHTNFLDILAQGDVVIRDLMRSHKPYRTPIAVLVADLEDAAEIRAQLPPEEYFELVNQIWGTMEPLFRKYYGTHGKHSGDGMVHYFLPRPDGSYVLGALECARAMTRAMSSISDIWRQRKHWMNELKLKIGIDEGEEWFGAYRTPSQLEATVLGDTVNRATRLSDFAAGGAVWVTKNTLGKLSDAERGRLVYGIRRLSQDDREIIVSATFSRISSLIDVDDPRFEELREISHLPITEVLSIIEAN